MTLIFYALVWCTAFAVWSFLSRAPLEAAQSHIEASTEKYGAEFRRQQSSVSPVTLARFEILGPVFALGISFLIGGGIVLPLAFGTLLYFIPRLVVTTMANTRIETLNNQFPEMLSMLVANLRAGLSIDGAMKAIQGGSPEPMASELRLICREIELGARVEAALRATAERARVPTFDSLATALSIVQSRGGDAPLLLEQFAATISKLRASEEAIKTETSGARFQGYLMLGMVPVFLVLLHLMDPQVVPNLFGTIVGNIVLALVAGICLAAYHLIQTFCNPDF